tara:strand:+ start:2249 stop:3322 length:1074 start_codon:yes stop_codon:yes gene_type:complete
VIIPFYLFKRFLLGLFVSIIVLVSIETFFSFTAEIKYLDQGNYNLIAVLKYTILNIPKSIDIMYPYAVLIGAMLSLGAMASDMEFVSMQSAGISVTKIISIILVQVFLFSCIFYYISDSVIPKYSSKAEKKKNIALNKKIIFHHNGVWFKDKSTFIKIDEIYADSNFRGITMYDYDENDELKSVKYVKEAYADNNKWLLKNVTEISLNVSPVIKKEYAEQVLNNFIDKNLISIKTNKSHNISLQEVTNNISYLEKNNLDSSIQRKIFWEKIFRPISTVLMLFLAMPFIFGKLRSTNTSKRIVIGIFIGIAFFIISSILPNIGMLIGLTPFINILLPHVVFAIAGKYLYEYQLEAGLR